MFHVWIFEHRFWYENSGEQAFTEPQLTELKKVKSFTTTTLSGKISSHQVSLARVLCDNAEDIRTIQPLAFQVQTYYRACVEDKTLS